MKTAILKLGPAGDKTRFEVHSTPSRGHNTVEKWYMRANHHVEATWWTQAISNSIQWAKREEPASRESGESEITTSKPKSLRASFQSTMSRRRKDTGSRGQWSQGSFVCVADEGVGDYDGLPPGAGKGARSHFASDDEGTHHDSSSASVLTQQHPPHNATFDLHGSSTAAQMELTGQLLSSLPLPPVATLRTQELHTALKDSFTMVQTMMDEYIQMAKEREEWWKAQLQRERERQSIWEESLQSVVREGETLERELRTRSRKRGSRFFDVGMGDVVRQRPATMGLESLSVPEEQAPDYSPPLGHPVPIPAAPMPEKVNGTCKDVVQSPATQPVLRHFQDDEDFDTDEEDEFFDAIEANALPNLVVSQLLTSPMHAEPALSFMHVDHFAGYQQLRTRLPIGSDNRPSTSLWSVLKNSIGKDLTRISFPVMFNEPTSMLQRMVSRLSSARCTLSYF